MKRNAILFGVIQGLVFPVIFFFIINEANNLLIEHYFGRPPGLSKRFIAILAIAANLIPISIANHSAATRTMRGIMSSTLVLTAIVVVYYWEEFW
ncbi:MAG TPA: hypothetical protein VNJ07_11125 [Chitinophagales bacterium]|nr:hypothetical protein [Chitinophagales bacterium]